MSRLGHWWRRETKYWRSVASIFNKQRHVRTEPLETAKALAETLLVMGSATMGVVIADRHIPWVLGLFAALLIATGVSMRASLNTYEKRHRG